MTFSNAEKSEDWVHFEWFLWEYNARVGYSGIQKGTVGTVGYNMGDTMSVWGRTTSIPACIRPPQKKDSSIVEESNSNGTKRNKIKHTEAAVGLKCLHRHLTNYPVYPPNCLLFDWSNVIKQVGTHCRFLSSTPPLQLANGFFEQSKIFYLTYTEHYTVPLCMSSVVLHHVNNR